jgi:mannose-6-phosphate isomerase-like protein (cupin superfamily)
MDLIVDANAVEAVAREHSDNKHLVRREALKIGLISVRPNEELPVHSHQKEEQFYYVLDGEGFLRLGEGEHPLRPGLAVSIPPGTVHGIRNPGPRALRFLDFFIDWGA